MKIPRAFNPFRNPRKERADELSQQISKGRFETHQQLKDAFQGQTQAVGKKLFNAADLIGRAAMAEERHDSFTRQSTTALLLLGAGVAASAATGGLFLPFAAGLLTGGALLVKAAAGGRGNESLIETRNEARAQSFENLRERLDDGTLPPDYADRGLPSGTLMFINDRYPIRWGGYTGMSKDSLQSEIASVAEGHLLRAKELGWKIS